MLQLRNANVFFVILATCFFGSGDLSVPQASPITVAEDGKRKINLSGRQRMLSQRMAKAAYRLDWVQQRNLPASAECPFPSFSLKHIDLNPRRHSFAIVIVAHAIRHQHCSSD